MDQRDQEKEKAIIVDIDDTTINIECLYKYFAGENDADWEALESDYNKCPPIPETVELINMFIEKGYKLIFVTARMGKEDVVEVTTKQLKTLFPNVNFKIHFRSNGDLRNDSVVKAQIYKWFIENKYDVKFVLDDRPHVVQMWEKQGLYVLQVHKKQSLQQTFFNV